MNSILGLKAFFSEFLNPEDGTDRLSRNISKKLPVFNLTMVYLCGKLAFKITQRKINKTEISA
jgi:hypothetical protein